MSGERKFFMYGEGNQEEQLFLVKDKGKDKRESIKINYEQGNVLKKSDLKKGEEAKKDVINLINRFIKEENKFYDFINKKELNKENQIEICPYFNQEIKINDGVNNYIEWWKNNKEKIKRSFYSTNNEEDSKIQNFLNYISSTAFSQYFLTSKDDVFDKDIANSVLKIIKDSIKIQKQSSNGGKTQFDVIKAIFSVSKATSSQSELSKYLKEQNKIKLINGNSQALEKQIFDKILERYSDKIAKEISETIIESLKKEESKTIEYELKSIQSAQRNLIFLKNENEFLSFIKSSLANESKPKEIFIANLLEEKIKSINQKNELFNKKVENLTDEELKKIGRQIGEYYMELILNNFNNYTDGNNKFKNEEIDKLKKHFGEYSSKEISNLSKIKGEVVKDMIKRFIDKIALRKATAQGYFGEGIMIAVSKTFGNIDEIKHMGSKSREDKKGQQAHIDAAIGNIGFQIKQYNAAPLNALFYSEEHQGSFDIFGKQIEDYIKSYELRTANVSTISYLRQACLKKEEIEKNRVANVLMPYLSNLLRITDGASRYIGVFYIYNQRLIPISLYFVIILKEYEEREFSFTSFFNFKDFFGREGHSNINETADKNLINKIINEGKINENQMSNLLTKRIYTSGVRFFMRDAQNKIINYIQ